MEILEQKVEELTKRISFIEAVLNESGLVMNPGQFEGMRKDWEKKQELSADR